MPATPPYIRLDASVTVVTWRQNITWEMLNELGAHMYLDAAHTRSLLLP